MGKRTKARECALQLLYGGERSREPFERVARGFWRLRTTTDETRARSEALARGVLEHQAELDAALGAALTNWRFERLAAVDLCILRLASYELLHERHTPAPVVIDEAVELAKRFADANSPAFVNGVLDAVRRGRDGASGAEPPAPSPARRRKARPRA